MAQSLSKILLHTMFSTKNREQTIPVEIQPDLHDYLGGILRDCGCPAIEINSMPDHIHLLHVLSRTITVSEVVRQMKHGSSKWMHGRGVEGFHWQNGYGVFSIGQSQVETVRAYIRNQQEHHRVRTFQEEFRGLLERYQVKFEEAYVWD